MKAGVWTTEFWITLAGQAVAAAALLGFVAAGDVDDMNAALAKGITGAAAVLASALAVVQYVRARTLLKQGDQGGGAPGAGGGGLAAPTTPRAALALAFALLFTGGAWAQERSTFEPAPSAPTVTRAVTSPACWGRRRPPAPPQTDPQVLALLQQLLSQNGQILALLQRPPPAAPAPPSSAPHVLILAPDGSPRLHLSPDGTPRLLLPPDGAPRIVLPPEGTPRRALPPDGTPRAAPLSPDGAPRLPLPTMLPAPAGYQSYTVWGPDGRPWVVYYARR